MSRTKPRRIGVLALQGDFAAHRAAPGSAGSGCEVVDVRRSGQLEDLCGLVLPGGESTTLLRLLGIGEMDEALLRFHTRGGRFFATCAGLILLAREVQSPSQQSLGLLDIVLERNGFGRQKESFIDRGRLEWPGREPEEIEMVFIRAPRILAVGPLVEVLATWRGEPVLVRQGSVLAATFHPELTPGGRLHELWARELLVDQTNGTEREVEVEPGG